MSKMNLCLVGTFIYCLIIPTSTTPVTEELVSTTYPIPDFSEENISTDVSDQAVPTVRSGNTDVTSSVPTTSVPTTSSTTVASSSAPWVTSGTTHYKTTTVGENECLENPPSARYRRQAPKGKKKLSTQAKIVATAKKYIGSTKWSIKSNHRGLAGKPKCNIFVAEVLEEAGVPVPHRHWYCWSPIGAKEWAKPNSDILFKAEGWVLVKNPKPGDVVAFCGHVGIVTGNRLTTSASSITGKVEENNWGFRKDQKPTFWRYRAKGQPVDQ